MAITESPCYKRNYLTDVIVRIDFSSPEDDLQTKIKGELSKLILSYFPIQEPKQAFLQHINIQEGLPTADRRDFTEWNFWGTEKEKRLVITQDFIFVSYNQFTSWGDLRDEFTAISTRLFYLYPEIQARRVGVRFINQITVGDGKPSDWEDYINPQLLGLMNYQVEGGLVSRNLHNFEYKFDDYQFRMQFGQHNPDYPAPIKRRQFILDYDAARNGLIEPTEVQDCIEQYHETIQAEFERNITDGLRKALDEE